MAKGLDIIIVNYYSKNRIEKLLRSIVLASKEIDSISIIIINNSPDELLDFAVQENIYLKIIINNKNNGFGYACNQSIPYLTNEFCLLLNPDTILFENSLIESIRFMDAHTDYTVLGVKHFNEKGQVVPSCSRFPTLASFIFDTFLVSKIFPNFFKPLFLMTDWHHLESQLVDQVMGAYLLTRKSFIDKHGFMDERYFVFLEDMDFCKKVWENGGKVFYNSNISIIHEGASSTDNVSHKKMAYLMNGKLQYCKKHFSKSKYLVVFPLIVVIEPLIRFLFTLFFKRGDLRNVIKGYKIFVKNFIKR